jgi:Mn-dependent DtxR family transcriptional regulator
MVLFAALLFAISLLIGKRQGILWRLRQKYLSRWQADQEHLLRGFFELLESEHKAPAMHGDLRSDLVDKKRLANKLGWSRSQFNRIANQLVRKGWLVERGADCLLLSSAGIQQSHRAVRRHRLLELYFSRWADLSPDAIDRCADYTEHALDDELLARLERDALDEGSRVDVPPSIHPVH